MNDPITDRQSARFMPPTLLRRVGRAATALLARTTQPTSLTGPAADRRLNLALQGGGAHGAFTWGVLDALLSDPTIGFEGLSGSSAGAMNAVVLANGWMTGGGREGARRALSAFWTAVGKQLPSAMTTGGGEEAIGLSLAGKFLTQWASHFSPAQLNPFDLNPLRDLLQAQVDFAGLREASPFKLFVGTTEANSGRLRVFREQELTAEVLLASACLPKIHHAIEIDGTPYWDGGYSANPAVFPLFYHCDCPDVLLVLLSPLVREQTPSSVEEIDSRIAELGFSSHFLREMRTFTEAKQFSTSAPLAGGRLEQRLGEMRFHMIDSSRVASLARSETKQLAYGPFLEMLRDQGVERGEAWLATHRDRIGRSSTIDLQHLFA